MYVLFLCMFKPVCKMSKQHENMPTRKILRRMIRRSSCGMDPAQTDHLSPEEMFDNEIHTNGYVTNGILWTRVCEDCQSYGLGKCTMKPAVDSRSVLIRGKNHTECGDCPVCYDPVTKKNIVKTKCGHVFHNRCFIDWTNMHDWEPPCPMCRTPLESVWCF
jgi:hypothetical protein